MNWFCYCAWNCIDRLRSLIQIGTCSTTILGKILFVVSSFSHIVVFHVYTLDKFCPVTIFFRRRLPSRYLTLPRTNKKTLPWYALLKVPTWTIFGTRYEKGELPKISISEPCNNTVLLNTSFWRILAHWLFWRSSDDFITTYSSWSLILLHGLFVCLVQTRRMVLQRWLKPQATVLTPLCSYF